MSKLLKCVKKKCPFFKEGIEVERDLCEMANRYIYNMERCEGLDYREDRTIKLEIKMDHIQKEWINVRELLDIVRCYQDAT